LVTVILLFIIHLIFIIIAPCESSDDNLADPNNYKGIFYGTEEEKYNDPITGAHFEHSDMCSRIHGIIQERNSVEERIKEKLLQNRNIGNL
jgi:hypothetical protein